MHISDTGRTIFWIDDVRKELLSNFVNDFAFAVLIVTNFVVESKRYCDNDEMEGGIVSVLIEVDLNADEPI